MINRGSDSPWFLMDQIPSTVFHNHAGVWLPMDQIPPILDNCQWIILLVFSIITSRSDTYSLRVKVGQTTSVIIASGSYYNSTPLSLDQLILSVIPIHQILSTVYDITKYSSRLTKFIKIKWKKLPHIRQDFESVFLVVHRVLVPQLCVL